MSFCAKAAPARAVPDRETIRVPMTSIREEKVGAIAVDGLDNRTGKPATRAGEATCCRGERCKNLKKELYPRPCALRKKYFA